MEIIVNDDFWPTDISPATNISIFGKTTKKCTILSDSNEEIKVLSRVKSS